MSKNPHAQNSLDVNLADIIPYTLTLANNNESLVLTRGVMQGQIQTDSLLLEFEQELNIPMNNMVFHQTKSEGKND